MEISEQQLKAEGFTQDQIHEINEGLKVGLNVSIYAKKEFLSIQMRQIRLGLLEGLPVEKYASLKYDWFQMEEIRKGLSEGVNITLFANPEISYDRMHQIRKGLESGIDLSPYRKLESGILKQLRLAILHRINIVPYINAGYDTEQLEAIRKAFEKGLEIVPYLKKAFLGISIQEICEGLEHGLDVSIYAKPEYCWQQMREIRLGLENRVDVEQYSNVYYSWRQMKEIRLGLEEGLDVSYYKSLMYPAKEMHARRLALKDHTASVIVREEIFPKESDHSDNYRIRVSPDEMEAVLEIYGSPKDLNRTEILKVLRNYGICYGIRYDEIDNIIKGNYFRKPILIAQGTPTRDGEDGWYEYFFRTEVARTPKVLEHGNVDYRNVEWFETVEKGQKLAFYHVAKPGENGITVTGKTIPARKGREQAILTGDGFKRLEDGKTYISTMQGIVTIQDFRLDVSRLLVMDEVNLTTGDVDFVGSVLIKGNVSNGTKIKATEDVIVKGFVEGSQITCGGNAVLRQGMNASGNGFIHAGKDVLGCFFESTDIYAGGNIHGDYFLNCRMHTERKLNVTGKKGMLAGGNAYAEEGLRTYNLGNQAGLATFVKIGIGERFAKKEAELDNAVREVNQELCILGNAHLELQHKYPAEIRNTMEIYLKIESAVYTKEKEMENLLREKDRLEKEKNKMEFVSAVIDNQVYEGVTVEIDKCRWISKNVQGVTLKKKNNKIAVYAN
ncbi:MAG: FapA family protein [Lachnospiraceae bacterium]|nr:FapA family protein [Lachnospiraceae bacterium]